MLELFVWWRFGRQRSLGSAGILLKDLSKESTRVMTYNQKIFLSCGYYYGYKWCSLESTYLVQEWPHLSHLLDLPSFCNFGPLPNWRSWHIRPLMLAAWFRVNCLRFHCSEGTLELGDVPSNSPFLSPVENDITQAFRNSVPNPLW